MSETQMERMQCMEVWGGNQSVNRAFTTTGLDVWISSQPHATSQRGGDVYYVSSCSSGRITRVLLADVSGHGDAVAGRADVLRGLMGRHINHISDSSLVKSINQDFVAESTDGTFATALIGTYFFPTKTLTLSNAGHPSPLIYRKSSKAWIQLSEEFANQPSVRNVPLGIEAGQDYSSTRLKLEPGDLVLCFTDGLIEFNRPDGSMLGEAGLLDIVSQLDSQNPSELLNLLIERVAPSSQMINSLDDTSILMFRRNEEHVPLSDNLFAPFRAVKHMIQQWIS